MNDPSVEDNTQFVSYFLSRAYDVISDSTFKKHLINCRDKGDAWAVRMHFDMTAMCQSCRKVQTRISNMHGTIQHAQWASICKEIMSSASPPTRVYAGHSVCSLTGETLDYSIDLSRPGKNGKTTHVHLKYWYFFLFLWFISKIEYVIRSLTKQWLESLGSQQTKPEQVKSEVKPEAKPETHRDYTVLCERFRSENEHLMEQLGQLYRKAQRFVEATIDLYESQFDVQPVLNPPEDFFLNNEPHA